MGQDNRRQVAATAVYFAQEEALKGAREIGGNNRGFYVEKYLNANHPDRITHRAQPWCVAFYLWCWLEAARTFGVRLPVSFTRSAGVLMERMRERQQLQLRTSARPEAQQPARSLRAEPGDAVFFDGDDSGHPDHVSMVLRVDPEGNLLTIGGNEGSEESGAPVRVKNRGPLLQVPHLLAVGWMLSGEEGDG